MRPSEKLYYGLDIGVYQGVRVDFANELVALRLHRKSSCFLEFILRYVRVKWHEDGICLKIPPQKRKQKGE